MSHKLKLSDDLSVPAEVLSQTQAIVSIKGAGKTYAAMKMMEEAVKAGFQSVALDPTGVWWGISAAGEGSALPVLVMGGEHGNVPLESTSGEVVAEFIVDSGQSVVLDLSLMRKAEMHRFTASFLDRLYHYKATRRENLHVFFDEADTAAPQRPGDEQARVLGAAEDVVRRGRSRGLGMTMITQRPAVLNKNLLEMCDTLYVMRVIGVNDQKAVRDRVSVDADGDTVDKMMDSLASLSNGEAWIWSPSALNIFKRFRFGKKQTFDSSRSPKPGERQVQPKTRAAIDLDGLTARIKATVEKAKENDPKALKMELARVRADLAKAQAVKPAPVKTETRTVEKSVLKDGQITRVESLSEKLMVLHGKYAEILTAIKAASDEIASAIKLTRQPLLASPAPSRLPTAVRTASSTPAKPPADISGRESLTGPEKKIIDAIAWLESIGVSEPEQTAVAFLAGYSYGGGGFNNPRGRLNQVGLVEYREKNTIRLTNAGRSVASIPEEPLTIKKLHEKVLSVLPGPEKKILEPLLASYPDVMSNEDLAIASGYTNGGGGYNNPRGRLRTLGLVEYRDGGVVARSILFPEM